MIGGPRLIWLNQIALQWVKALTPLATGLVWPILVLVLVLLFRGQIRELLGRLRHFKGPGVDADFDAATFETATFVAAHPDVEPEPAPDSRDRDLGDTATDASDEPPLKEGHQLRYAEAYYLRANENPAYAILSTYSMLERWYDRALLSHGLAPYAPNNRKLDVRTMAQIAVKAQILPPDSVKGVEGLRQVRNLAAHQPDSITVTMAREFLDLLDDVVNVLNRTITPATVELPPDIYPAP